MAQAPWALGAGSSAARGVEGPRLTGGSTLGAPWQQASGADASLSTSPSKARSPATPQEYQGTDSWQFALTRPSASAASAGPRPELHPGDLPKEVAARELELRALREEVESRELEAAKLYEEARDAEQKLHQVSGHVSTLSANLEASTVGQHSILEAATKHADSAVAGLQRRIARSEWELSEKHQEIATLRQATAAGQRLVAQQTGDLQALRASHSEQGLQVAALSEDKARLQRHKAIGEWRANVQAQIEQEQLDAVLVRERREKLQQIDALEEEISTLRAYAARTEDKCNHHAAQIERLQQHFDELVMEERLCMSAERLSSETGGEQKRQRLEELRALEAQLRNEVSQYSAQMHHVTAYEQTEADMVRHQEELGSIIGLTREISRKLGEAEHRSGGDALETAMDSFLRSMQEMGQAPQVQRLGPGQYRIAGEQVRCALSEGGRLCVKETHGGLTLMGDYLKARGVLDREHRTTWAVDSKVGGAWRGGGAPASQESLPTSLQQDMSGLAHLFRPLSVGSAGQLMAV